MTSHLPLTHRTEKPRPSHLAPPDRHGAGALLASAARRPPLRVRNRSATLTLHRPARPHGHSRSSGSDWTARNTSSGQGGRGRHRQAVVDAFTVVKVLDETSPALLDLTFAGTFLAEVRIDVVMRRRTTASYVLLTALIVANQRQAPPTGGPALQTLSFSPKAVRETIVSPGGTVTTCFDLVSQTATERGSGSQLAMPEAHR